MMVCISSFLSSINTTCPSIYPTTLSSLPSLNPYIMHSSNPASQLYIHPSISIYLDILPSLCLSIFFYSFLHIAIHTSIQLPILFSTLIFHHNLPSFLSILSIQPSLLTALISSQPFTHPILSSIYSHVQLHFYHPCILPFLIFLYFISIYSSRPLHDANLLIHPTFLTSIPPFIASCHPSIYPLVHPPFHPIFIYPLTPIQSFCPSI